MSDTSIATPVRFLVRIAAPSAMEITTELGRNREKIGDVHDKVSSAGSTEYTDGVVTATATICLIPCRLFAVVEVVYQLVFIGIPGAQTEGNELAGGVYSMSRPLTIGCMTDVDGVDDD